ncbi:MAG: hypothetical protein ACR2JQ_11330 [Mycobacteriales bacterium]
MGAEDLVCGACSGRVSEGRCRVCRAMRDELGIRHGPDWQTVLLPLLAAIAAAICLISYYVRLAT